jgi:flagellar hook-associated protein 1 FlgK
MATLGATLNIGSRALYAFQQAINVTGNNIANANTEGYSRQRAVLEAAPTIDTPIGPEGTGVTAASI